MEGKAALISADIATGNFDVTWEKYELGVVAANKLVSIDGGKKAELSILELWEKFKEYKRPSLAKTTFITNWEKKYTKFLIEAINNTNGSPIEVRNHLINNRDNGIVKALLSALENAFQWGIQHELLTKNPFLGMSKEVVIKKKQKDEDESFNEYEDTRAFTINEMNAIIEYFETTPTVKHWANYVKFLFYTGCRPGEAAALRWKHISGNCKIIKFAESYDWSTKITKCTKTETIRLFPCHQKLESLILTMKADGVNPDDLVFTSKTGNQIKWGVFSNVWRGREEERRKSVIKALIEQDKVKQYLKPYATRHTFITHQVNGGVDAHVIAAWCGNSADIIWQHYYQHKQNVMPIEM